MFSFSSKDDTKVLKVYAEFLKKFKLIKTPRQIK